LARGLKPLLKTGSTITKKVGEDALLDLSDKFDSIDDEYAGTIASHLDMAIELMQDGYPGDATKKLKQFNKACKDVLNGKEVGSAFESTITEGTYNSKNHIGSTSDGQGSNAEIYKKGKGYYVVVSGEADYDFDAKNGKELLKKLKDNEFDSTDILEVNESKEDFKPHMMYDPKTGKGYKAETQEDHERMNKLGYVHEKPEEVNEAKFTRRSLMRAMKKDDGMIQLGNGQEYVIYAYGNGNDDNDDMWGDKTIFAIDKDGEEHEIEYSDIVRYDESVVNEATDLNDPVLVAYRATRRDLPKLKFPKVKSRRLSFDKYMDLLDDRLDIDQQIKDLRDEMAQTLRGMEQEAEPEGGEIADEYGSTMMKQEKEYTKLMAKKNKIMARIEKHRMA